jgi:Tat protein secretion system quality control protein TatD with DNase activity
MVAAAAVVATASSFLAFDAHNHIQLGPSPPLPSSSSKMSLSSAPSSISASASATTTTTTTTKSSSSSSSSSSNSTHNSLREYMRHELNGCLCGMAIMSTHPRDFQPLLDLEKEMNNDADNGNGNGNGKNNVMKIIPCLGVHPWFLHELEHDDWDMVPSSSSSSSSVIIQQQQQQQAAITMVPKWIAYLEEYIIQNPHVPVGEIGLDGFHFDFDTKELTTPMEQQIEAFKYQLQVATKYHRPVSVHCVRAMGKIMDAINDVATTNNNNIHRMDNVNDDDDNNNNDTDTVSEPPLLLLPPRIYFHAFGGKAATAIQLIRTIEKIKPSKRKNKNKKKIKNNTSKVYFGFAPVINLNVHSCSKTMDVIRAVGIHRLVLETDHEDIQRIQSSMEHGIDIISTALDCTPAELIRITNNNINDLYNISI